MTINTTLRHINILNLILIGIIAIFGIYALAPMYDVRVKYITPSPKKSHELQEEKSAQVLPQLADYTIISEQNPFHPERKIPVDKKSETFLKPEFVLYGTLITADTRIAYMEDLKAPYNTAGRGKRQRALRIGNTLSGYAVSDIQYDRVVMVQGEERVEVKVSAHTRKGRTIETIATGPVPPSGPQATPTTVNLRDKQQGSGRPPGVIHEGPLPPGVQAPSKEDISRVKDAFGSFIKEKLGNK